MPLRLTVLLSSIFFNISISEPPPKKLTPTLYFFILFSNYGINEKAGSHTNPVKYRDYIAAERVHAFYATLLSTARIFLNWVHFCCFSFFLLFFDRVHGSREHSFFSSYLLDLPSANVFLQILLNEKLFCFKGTSEAAATLLLAIFPKETLVKKTKRHDKQNTADFRRLWFMECLE